MGKTIQRLAEIQGDEVVLTFDVDNKSELTVDNLQKVDVAIEFTRPETAVENIKVCLDAGIPVVCGTTGWLERKQEVVEHCEAAKGAFFYASNFSIGVNIFFAINRYLAGLMAAQPQYEVKMEEIHHTQKLDHPSGTAITLAQGILENISRKSSWQTHLETAESQMFECAPSAVPIISKRVDKVPGTHVITWQSGIDTIEISHTAHSREGFALGAIEAARWLIGRKGVYGMKEMLGF